MASMAGFYVSPFFLELNSVAAMAQNSGGSDYRALVCVYLQGGNDGHGTVIATDADSYAAFTQARSGAPGLAYPLSALLPITLQTPQSGRTFALNPSLTGVQNLFNAGRAAIVANTGTLVTPATKTQIDANSVALPDSLFSHFDQTAAWQAIASNLGSGEHIGWGGAVADAIEAMNMNSNSMFTCISTSGNALFLAGQTSFQLNVTSAGPIPIYGLANPTFGSPAASDRTQFRADGRGDKPVCAGVRSHPQSLHAGAVDAGERDGSGRGGRSGQSASVSRPRIEQADGQPAGCFDANCSADHCGAGEPGGDTADLLRTAGEL